MAQAAVLAVFAVVATRALSEPKNDFRFSIMGDRTGGPTPEIYGRVWREVNLMHPDFVINVGDTIQGHRPERMTQEWSELRPIWEQYRHYPLYFTPGNHDIWSPESRELYEKESRRRAWYSFDYQEAHFTVLDNSQTPDLSPEQLQFLEKDLKANSGKRPKFVFFHKPFWIAPIRLRSGEFSLHRLVKKYNVDYVISGHGHQFVRLERDGIVYMEVGSSGGSIRRGLDKGEGFAQGWFYHHVWGRVKGSRADFTVKEIDGPVGKGRMFRAEDWGESGPKFDIADPAAAEKPRT